MKEQVKKLIEAFLGARYIGASTYEVAVVERRAVDSFCVTIPDVGPVWIRSLHDSEKHRDFIEYEAPELVAAETEQEMIARIAANDAARLTKQLKAVQRSGFPSSKAVNELLSINGLIQFGRPTAKILYNHYRLTDRAVHFLKTGSMDGGEESLAAAA